MENTTISHVTEFGKFTSVPEPSGLLLLGLGLIGLSIMRRRSKS
ncbi:PEP-CTERM sorting domain-containing protein [Cellvibrio sp.]